MSSHIALPAPTPAALISAIVAFFGNFFLAYFGVLLVTCARMVALETRLLSKCIAVATAASPAAPLTARAR